MSQIFKIANPVVANSLGSPDCRKRDTASSSNVVTGLESAIRTASPFLLKLTFAKGILLPMLIEFPFAVICLSWIYSGVAAFQTSPESLWARPFGVTVLLGIIVFCIAITTDGLFCIFRKVRGKAVFSISANGIQSHRFWISRTWAWNEIEKMEVTRSNSLFATPRVSFTKKGLLSLKAKMPRITKKQRENVKQAVMAFAPHHPIHEQTALRNTNLLDRRNDAPTINANALGKLSNAAKIRIDPIEFHIRKSNTVYAAGAVAIGSLLMWYAAFYLAWPDYRPTAHWFELGKKLARVQDFLIQAFAYPPLVRTVPVIVGATLLVIDGFWRISIFYAMRPILKIDALGVSAFKFWSPIKLPWTEIEEVMKSELRHGITMLALLGKHEFGKRTSGFPFFQILRPQINLYHLSDTQMQVVESLIAHNVPHVKRTLRIQDKIVQVTNGQ